MLAGTTVYGDVIQGIMIVLLTPSSVAGRGAWEAAGWTERPSSLLQQLQAAAAERVSLMSAERWASSLT